MDETQPQQTTRDGTEGNLTSYEWRRCKLQINDSPQGHHSYHNAKCVNTADR